MYRILLALSFAALTIFSSFGQNFRSYDGRGNNLDNPTWGAVFEPLIIETSLEYSDGIAAANGQNRPNPREISNVLFSQDSLLPDVMSLSDYVWAFGQFVDHDITITPPDEHEDFTIDVPRGDEWFDPDSLGTAQIPMSRTEHIDGTGETIDNPRMISNVTTAFIDGSSFYGHNQEISQWLRTYVHGKLKTSNGNLLPFNTITGEFDSDIDPNAPFMADDVGLSLKHFIAGDVRGNENPLLTSLHTLFIREHNRICDELRVVNLNWRDERIYQEARKRTVAIFNAIIYEEWLPTMGIHLPDYQGYDRTLNAGISNVFTVTAYRMGHTLLSGTILRLDNDGNPIPEGHIKLKDAFFNPLEITKVGGLEPYFKGMGAQAQQKFDAKMLDDVRNFLFSKDGELGMDLAAININRGRERGVPDYNSIREHYGMGRLSDFSEINSNTSIADALETLYGSVNNIDPWVGMLSEERMPNSIFGELVIRVLTKQFQNLRDGDRYYYQNDPHLTDDEKAEIKNTRMHDVLMRNTNLSIMQPNVFEAVPHSEICIAQQTSANIEGKVYREDGTLLKGVAVEVSTATNSQAIQAQTGNYVFSDLITCKNYVLKADKPESVYEGISTIDIMKISKHVLNIDLLDSPYKILAADVNNSGTITTLDIIGVRKIVLRVSTEFRNQKVWEFIPADFQFDIANVWANPIPHQATISKFETNEIVDFVAYKMGDVDNSFIIQAKSVDDRTENVVALKSNNPTLKDGEVTRVPIYAQDFIELAGMQFTLSTTNPDVSILGINGVAIHNLNEDNYFINEAGILTFSWNGEQNLNKDDILFEIEVEANRDVETDKIFELSSKLTAAEAYDASLTISPVTLDFNNGDLRKEFVLYQNNPNPFSSETKIRFNLTEASNAQLIVYDLSGKKVLIKNKECEAGYHFFEINHSDLNHSGIYQYQISTNFGIETRKMILTK